MVYETIKGNNFKVHNLTLTKELCQYVKQWRSWYQLFRDEYKRAREIKEKEMQNNSIQVNIKTLKPTNLFFKKMCGTMQN